MKVEFYKHNLGREEKDLLIQVLDGVFLTAGPRTSQFESEFAAYFGRKYGVGMTSWTTAAFLVLKAWGIGEDDEVIVPAMTFIASANIVLHCGAKVVFCDSEPVTGNIDPAKIESLITKKTKAIIPVHMYGQMADMRAIRTIADRHGLKVMEDCAHCIEGKRDGYAPGALSDAAVFSFYATKNITCGEGGAVVTDDNDLVEKLKLLRLHGMSKSAADRYHGTYKHYEMELLGYKANMNDIQAALLLPQLKKMDGFRTRREEVCRQYERRFDAAGIRYPKVLPDSVSARHLFTVWVSERSRDTVIEELQRNGIGVAVNFRAAPTLGFYRDYLAETKVNVSVAESIGNSTITLPLYVKLTDAEINYVADQVVAAARKFD